MFSHFTKGEGLLTITYTSNSVFKTEAIIFLPDRPQPMVLDLTSELLFLPIFSSQKPGNHPKFFSTQVVLRLTHI